MESEAERRKEEAQAVALFSSSFSPQAARIHLVLDSGANEFMFKDTRVAESFDSRQTKIVTASGSNQVTGKFGKTQQLFFPGNTTQLKTGMHNKAVFSEGLEDNLAREDL